jgi:hypothetical protein
MKSIQKISLIILFLSVNMAHFCAAHKKFKLSNIFSPVIKLLKFKTSSKIVPEDTPEVASIVECQTNSLNTTIDPNSQTSAKNSIDSNIEENKELNNFICSLDAKETNTETNTSDPDFKNKIPDNLLPKK